MDARSILRSGNTVSPVDDLGATLAHRLESASQFGAQIKIGRRLIPDLGAMLGHRLWSAIESGAQIVVGGEAGRCGDRCQCWQRGQ
jgi:hypothetical protein